MFYSCTPLYSFCHQLLWPGGKFFLTFRIQSKDNNDNKGAQTTSHQGGRNVAQPPTFEQQLEAARRASDVKKIIFGE